MATTCYLCGGQNVRVTRRRLRHDVKRDVLTCSTCSLVFLRPRKQDLQSYYATEYRRQYSPTIDKEDSSREIFNMYHPLMGSRVERVKKYLGKKKKVLDIGASTGHFLAALKPHVGECVGLEFNLANAEFARKELGIRMYTDPIEKTDLPENYFDVIFCLQTLEHMEDPLAFLKTLKRYLKKGGTLYIEVPNLWEASLSVYHNKAYEDFYYREPHLFYYNPLTLARLMKKAGYKGTVAPFQWYNVMNQMHWLLAHGPQKNGEMGLKTPVLVESADAKASLKKEFNTWMQKIDREYKRLLEKYQVSDQIVFVGKVS